MSLLVYGIVFAFDNFRLCVTKRSWPIIRDVRNRAWFERLNTSLICTHFKNHRGMAMTSSWLILRSLMLAVLVVMIAPSFSAEQSKSEPKPPPAAYAPTPAPIDRNGVLILIRSTLLALDHANKTGNYTVLHDLGSPAFQNNTAARLAEIFAAERQGNLDFSGIAVIDPQLTLLPQIEANGMMHMAGFFPSVSTQVNFELAYAPVDRQWRLFDLSVSLGPAAPVPPPSPEPPPTAAPEALPANRPSDLSKI
jgi:hypothetical protein